MPQSIPVSEPIQNGIDPSFRESSLTDDGIKYDIQTIHDMIAGRIEPEPMLTPKTVLNSLERVAIRTGRKAPQWMKDDFNLQHYHGGKAVMTFTSETGIVTVFAVGAEYIGKLLKHLSNVELEKILICYPSGPVSPPKQPAQSETVA